MKAIETSASFNEKGELSIDNLPQLKNQKVRLLFLYADDAEEGLYASAARSLSKAYAADEPEYDASMIKEPNPLYKNERR